MKTVDPVWAVLLIFIIVIMIKEVQLYLGWTIVKKNKLNPFKLSRVKTRYHKVLFNKDQPYGHRIHRDRTKQNPRNYKYKKIEIDVGED